MSLAIWAHAPDVPTEVCFDARVGGKSGAPAYPGGVPKGQGGWDIGIRFSNLSDLADKLFRHPIATPRHLCGNWISDCPPIERGHVKRLAINVHGNPGMLYVNSQKNPALTPDNIANFHKDLHDIGLSTDQGSVILLMGCLAGQGREGTRLLQALSRVWPGRQIVAFSTIGFSSGGDMLRSGEFCTEPGMRDTDNTNPSLSWEMQQRDYGPLWKNLERLPWASEESPHAKVVRDGTILRGAQW